MKFSIIVAVSENLGIGYKGQIPWKLRKEMAYFSKVTQLTNYDNKNAVIMGRKTWESIPERFRPLKNRLNVVLSQSMGKIYPPDVVVCSSFQEALKALDTPPLCMTVGNVWIIGGSSVYEEALRNESCQRIYITKINKDFECDTFFPNTPEEFNEIQDDNVPKGIQEENGITYEFKVYERKKTNNDL